MQIRVFNEKGINLQGNLPLFGADSHVLFEFPLYQIIAHLFSDALNMDPVLTARLLTLVLFQISAICLLKLNSEFFRKENEIPLLVLYQFLPYGLFYGHAPIGEFLPVLLMYAAAIVESGRTNKLRTIYFLFSIVFVTFACLTKITTAIALMPLLLLRIFSKSEKARGFVFVRVIASTGIGLFLTSRWTDHADSLKATNEYTKALVSTNPRMVNWNFGTLDQRLDFGTWYHLLVTNMAPITLNAFILIIFAIYAYLFTRNSALLVLLACILLPLLLFTNLYLAHYYYLCAVYGIVLLLLTSTLYECGKFIRFEKEKYLVVLLILVGAASSANGSNSVQTILNHQGPPKEAEKLKSLTEPSDTILYFGCEWSAYLPYYSEREAIMVPSWIGTIRQSDFHEASTVYFCKTNTAELQKTLSLLDKSWKRIDGNVFIKVQDS
jgi:hypothetical protein